jgi:uncharacterized protein YneF (UPF0154 family)
MNIILLIFALIVALALMFIGVVIGLFAILRHFNNKMEKELDDDGFYD